MAAGLVVPISGPYTAVWNARTLGTQNDDGYVLTGAYQGQEINASDAYGMTLVEAIYRGLNWRVRFKGLEWNKAGILAAINTFGSTGDTGTTFTPTLANIGERMSKYAQAKIGKSRQARRSLPKLKSHGDRRRTRRAKCRT